LDKLRTRREEERSASQFANGAALLIDLYSGVVTAQAQQANVPMPMSV